MRPNQQQLEQIPDDLLHRRAGAAGDGQRALRLAAWLGARGWHPTGLQLDQESRRRRQGRGEAA